MTVCRSRRPAAVILACVAALGALASAADAAGGTAAGFSTPSHNISCTYDKSANGIPMICVVRSASTAHKQDVWLMPSFGKPSGGLEADGAVIRSLPVLGYGVRWSHGGITCSVTQSNLTCTNSDGHGFHLSKQSQRAF